MIGLFLYKIQSTVLHPKEYFYFILNGMIQ